MMWRSYLLLIYRSCCSVEMKSLGFAQQLYTSDKLQVSCLSTQTEFQTINHKHFPQVANANANIIVLSLWQYFIHVILILHCFCNWDILWKKRVLRKQSLPSIPFKKDTIVMLTSCVCALEENGRKTLDWPPNTLLLSLSECQCQCAFQVALTRQTRQAIWFWT